MFVAPSPIPEAEEEAEEQMQAQEWVVRASSWSNATTVDRANLASLFGYKIQNLNLRKYMY